MSLSARQAKQAHGRVAIFLLIFIAVHFTMHFSSLGGVEVHTEALGWARLLYQFPLIEMALVAGLALQIVLGFRLLAAIRNRKIKDRWHWVQFVSACYLAYFIVQHTAAALITRLYVGLDTNFYWAGGTLIIDPIRYGFAVYYTLAVIALVSHILAALHFRRPQRWHGPAFALGPIVGVIFVLGYGGAFAAYALPQEYRDYYTFFPGVESCFSPFTRS
ncbi:hypothetical protein [uncultured Erythrobacter sp.]|uniref:hypothetical protein n=1 Tax=uncultured Erythrobacter sp. TaxID=263913 RepID=UPI0026191CA7|nr:hypothetical protein [uncultured Erythrobacter sp.]